MSIIVKSIKLSTHHVVLLLFFSCMPEAMPIMGQPTVDRIDDTHFFNISKYFIRTHPTQAEFKKMIFFYLDGLVF